MNLSRTKAVLAVLAAVAIATQSFAIGANYVLSHTSPQHGALRCRGFVVTQMYGGFNEVRCVGEGR